MNSTIAIENKRKAAKNKQKSAQAIKKAERRKNRGIGLLLVLFIIAGLALLLYPSLANYWNKNFASRTVNNYTSAIADLSNEDYERLLKEAKAYNERLATGNNKLGVEVPGYEETLVANDAGIMGIVEIRKIDATMPIYHGTSDSVLAVAVGHLAWTSLPVGAASYDEELGIVTDPSDGSHCVISGHRGLPSARLFTDIDQLVEGDTFVIRTLDEILTYEVDQIRVIEPEDLSELGIVKGEDYCTLLTCTPYGVNSHRLLVRGRRVPTSMLDWFVYHIQSNATQIKPAIVAPLLAAPVIIILFFWAMINPGARKRRKRQLIDDSIMEELEVAELPLYKLDLSVMELNKLLTITKSNTDDLKEINRKNKKKSKGKKDKKDETQA